MGSKYYDIFSAKYLMISSFKRRVPAVDSDNLDNLRNLHLEGKLCSHLRLAISFIRFVMVTDQER